MWEGVKQKGKLQKERITKGTNQCCWVEECVWLHMWICFKAYQTWLQHWTCILLKPQIQKRLRLSNCISLQHKPRVHTISEQKRRELYENGMHRQSISSTEPNTAKTLLVRSAYAWKSLSLEAIKFSRPYLMLFKFFLVYAEHGLVCVYMCLFLLFPFSLVRFSWGESYTR